MAIIPESLANIIALKIYSGETMMATVSQLKRIGVSFNSETIRGKMVDTLRDLKEQIDIYKSGQYTEQTIDVIVTLFDDVQLLRELEKECKN